MDWKIQDCHNQGARCCCACSLLPCIASHVGGDYALVTMRLYYKTINIHTVLRLTRASYTRSLRETCVRAETLSLLTAISYELPYHGGRRCGGCFTPGVHVQFFRAGLPPQ